jgi:hypothetical protein
MYVCQENAVGGFPNEATFRFQCDGSKSCYLASAATFCTLKIERDVSNAKTDPIDVAQAARHYFLRDDEALEKRVLRNEGGHPFDLVNAITGHKFDEDDWASLNFPDFPRISARKEVGMQAIEHCVTKGPGLVLDFFITERFREAARA